MREWPYGESLGSSVGEALHYIKRRGIGVELIIHRSGNCDVAFHGCYDGKDFQGRVINKSLLQAVTEAWRSAQEGFIVHE